MCVCECVHGYVCARACACKCVCMHVHITSMYVCTDIPLMYKYTFIEHANFNFCIDAF